MDEVGRLHGQYLMTVQGFDQARADARDIAAAIRSRISREREADRLRVAELEKISAGGGAAARVAALELDTLRGKVYRATAAEVSAFDEAIARESEAAAELGPIRSAFTAAYDSALRELEVLRGEVVGDQLADLRGRWLEGDRKALEALR